MISDNNRGILSHSITFVGGLVTGILISYYNYTNNNKEKRYTKTHYNIIINDNSNNELLESYYIDYDKKIIYFEKDLKCVDVIFYTTNSAEPIYTKKQFSGNNFKLEF